MIVQTVNAEARLISTSLGATVGDGQLRDAPQLNNTNRAVATASATTARQKYRQRRSFKLLSMIGQQKRAEFDMLEDILG